MLRRIRALILLIFMAMGGVITTNAVFLQEGRHPAPYKDAHNSNTAGSQEKHVSSYDQKRRKRQRAVKVTPIPAVPVKPRTKPRPPRPGGLDTEALQAKLRASATNSINRNRQVVSRPAPKVEKPKKVARRIKPAVETVPPKNSRATIRLVQLGLDELGYDPGLIDGTMGDRTKIAIRQFEKDRRLPETGRISAALIKELRKVTGSSTLDIL